MSAPILTFIVTVLALSALPSAATSFKCKTADGKIEYSDSPCASDKQNLNKKVTETAAKPEPAPMERLTTLMKAFEEPLCEREKLALELGQQSRLTPVQRTALKPKFDRLAELNETQVDFQRQARKITEATGAQSPESTALRRFQSRVKQCPAGIPTTTSVALPTTTTVPPTRK